jgi:hypothetical protein
VAVRRRPPSRASRRDSDAEWPRSRPFGAPLDWPGSILQLCLRVCTPRRGRSRITANSETLTAVDVTLSTAVGITLLTAVDITLLSAVDITLLTAVDVTLLTAVDITVLTAVDVTLLTAVDVTLLTAVDITVVASELPRIATYTAVAYR